MERTFQTLHDPLERSIFFQEFRDQYASVDLTYEKFLDARDGRTAPAATSTDNPAGSPESFLSLTQKLYAQEPQAEPSWIRSPPVDRNYLYFVGEATSTSYDDANREAVAEAQAKAAREMRALFQSEDLTVRTQLDDLTTYLARRATVTRRYTRIISDTHPVTAFALLKVPRQNLGKLLTQFELENQVRINTESVNLLQQALNAAQRK
jgi:hypothetical protein